jgi:glutamine amidotransferase
MCRFVAYIGKPIMADELLIKPHNSLMKQSSNALESEMTVNGDGFGVGWYSHAIRKEPALFRSIRPAWNDENLKYNASMIKSHCLLAHIRAATQGAVSIENTHPFHYREFLMMQNGGINNFSKIKRAVINRLDEDLFEWVYGQTDTQYIFALFLTIAKETVKNGTALTLEELTNCLSQTFAEIQEMKKNARLDSPSLYNLVLTDGNAIIATRYSTQPDKETRSLHIASNVECYTSELGFLRFRTADPKDCSVLISSEVLSSEVEFWKEVPENHSIIVSEGLQVQINPLM